MGRKCFCCDAVLDAKPPDQDQFRLGQGDAARVLEDGGQAYLHPTGRRKYDIIVFGMPTNFHYGNGMGATPSR